MRNEIVDCLEENRKNKQGDGKGHVALGEEAREAGTEEDQTFDAYADELACL